MSSSVSQVVATIQQDNYGSLAIITAITYDYILTFPKEVEYVWNRPWTSVSTLFVLARYFGLSYVVWYYFSSWPSKGDILLIVSEWCLWIFIFAADLVIILRVWALYSRSKLILGTLLLFYATELTAFLITYIIIDARSPNNPLASTTQVLNFSFCTLGNTAPPIWGQALDAIQITLGALMCFLTLIQFIKESLVMYRVTKRFQLNDYMILLVREGLVYFIVILGFALFNVLGNAGIIPPNGGWLVLSVELQYVPPFTLTPRFILSLRELYARDARRKSDIDTAFGLALGSWHATTTSQDAAVKEGNEQGDEAQVEEKEHEICWSNV